MTDCPHLGDVFLNSQCDTERGLLGSLQAFLVVCRHHNRFEGGPVSSIRAGHCEEDEICIQNISPPGIGVPAGRAKMATCVEQRAFTKLQKDGEQWGLLAKSFQDTYLSMTASKLDISTPMEVSSFSVHARSQGQDDAVSATNGESFQCRNCVTLETQKFEDDADLLKTQARLLTTGIAVQGVIWIAVLLG